MTGKIAHKGPHLERRGAPDLKSPGDRSAPARAPRRERERPRVGWIATVAIMLMLLAGAGWELWRWLLLIITMD